MAMTDVERVESIPKKLRMGLQLGEIVNYVMAEGEERPMMVLRKLRSAEREDWDGTVCGVVFFDGDSDRESGQVLINKSVRFDPDKAVGTWNWGFAPYWPS
jgi:hypothetical protein